MKRAKLKTDHQKKQKRIKKLFCKIMDDFGSFLNVCKHLKNEIDHQEEYMRKVYNGDNSFRHKSINGKSFKKFINASDFFQHCFQWDEFTMIAILPYFVFMELGNYTPQAHITEDDLKEGNKIWFYYNEFLYFWNNHWNEYKF